MKFSRIHQMIIAIAVIIVVVVGVNVMRSRQTIDGRVKRLERMLNKKPKDAQLNNQLAQFYLRLGESEKAKRYFLKAITIEPDNAAHYFGLSNFYSSIADAQKTIESLQKAVELDPEFAEAYYNLAGPTAFLGQEQKAIEYMNKAIEVWKKQGKILEAGEAAEKFYIFMARQRGELKEISAKDFVSNSINK